MKKDINPTKVEDIGIAIVKETNELNQEEWNAYFLNLKNEEIECVIVRSNGYSEDKTTTELRRLLNTIPAQSAVKFEPLQPEIFELTNQFWVSFVLDNELQDKKFVFVPGSVDEKNFVDIPILGVEGVLIV